MTEPERIARAERAKNAMAEFIGPAFEVLEAQKLEAIIKAAVSSDPRAPEVQQRLSAQVQALRTVRGEIQAVIADGKVAQAEMESRAQMSRMSDYRRQVVGV